MSLLERVYFLHRQLTENRYPNSRTLMEAFEVSQPTARRDVAYLRDRLLAPIGFDQQRNGFYYTKAGFDLPFTDSPRIVFLLGMLNRLAEETGLSGLPEIRQLENRLSAMVGRDQAHITESIHCEWVEVEHPDARIFDTIIEAIVKRRQLGIDYRSPSKKSTSRTVDPLKLINYQGRWYLSAWCLLRGAHRTFHLARITAARLTGRITAPADLAGQDLDRSFGIFKGPPRYTAQIRFISTAAELVRNQTWHKDQRITADQAGIMLHIPVHDDREIIMKILQYGSMAEVIGPQALRDRMEEELHLMQRTYRAGR